MVGVVRGRDESFDLISCFLCLAVVLAIDAILLMLLLPFGIRLDQHLTVPKRTPTSPSPIYPRRVGMAVTSLLTAMPERHSVLTSTEDGAGDIGSSSMVMRSSFCCRERRGRLGIVVESLGERVGVMVVR